ncbi:hypothetical protein LCGC14_0484870 [marine sediment metagenome]|uniref:Uncharacterized protein n=1 Tax=marine sediment metagenome TaxID=412755 RepID=A0A0F9SDJ6_9ZZZZ
MIHVPPTTQLGSSPAWPKPRKAGLSIKKVKKGGILATRSIARGTVKEAPIKSAVLPSRLVSRSTRIASSSPTLTFQPPPPLNHMKMAM